MITIISEEKSHILINKPAGLFSQAAPGIASVCTELTEQLKTRDDHPGRPFIGLPHRLDRATSGIMLIARNQRALKRFGQQFQTRKIAKFYLAVLARAHASQGDAVQHSKWIDYVRKIPDVARAEICSPDADGAKRAELDIRFLHQRGDLCLALIKLLTGRMHQIRIQAASRGLPVLGDPIYAASDPGAQPGEELGYSTMALHALRLEFRHPAHGRLQTATAPIPASWQALIDGEQTQFIDALQSASRRSAEDAWDLERLSLDAS